MEVQGRKTGYLRQDFRLFYNRDREKRTFPPHYHDFHKLMILLGGNVTYWIEGRSYELLPGDVVLVPEGALHYPVIHDDTLYERIIFYLSDSFFECWGQMSGELKKCFTSCEETHSFLIRPGGENASRLSGLYSSLVEAALDEGSGAEVVRRCRAMELLVVLGRLLADPGGRSFTAPSSSNPVIADVLAYLNDNLANEDLCIDDAAAAVNLDRSYLMHLFKASTGYTIGRYVTEKRLYAARALLDQGYSVTEACFRSGFKNYSAFYYAWRKKYASSPQRGNDSAPQVEGE